MKLSIKQKKALVNYLLGEVGKGPFEDLEPFQTEEVEENFNEYREAADDFINAIRKSIINALDRQGD